VTYVLRLAGLCAASFLLLGCAAHKLQTRKKERQAAYAALPAEQRTLIDKQIIDVGFSTNAVYIAWGAPAHVVPGVDDQTFTWIYRCTYLKERREWRPREVVRGRVDALYQTMEYDTTFDPHTYVCGEVVFESGAVKVWRVFPRPETRPFR
jgi:hypothetical protein